MTTEDIITRLAARMEAFDAGDAGAVITADALAEAGSLSEIADQDAAAAEILQHFHQRRAIAHLSRFDATLDRAELDAAFGALDSLRQVLQTSAEALSGAHTLEIGLRMRRFALTTDGRDLDRAIEYSQQAAAEDPDDWELSSTLGDLLRMRFESGGETEDLDQAVEAYRAAVERMPADAPERSLRQAVLFENLFTQSEYNSSKSRQDAVEWPAEAVRRLVLRTVRVGGDDTWLWELLADDRPVARTQVLLGDGWQREPFEDLSGYLSRYSIPNASTDHLRDLLTSVGAWVTARVLGPELAAEIAARLPAIVTVQLHSRQHRLLAAPLELAQVAGKSLAAGGVVFAYSLGGGKPASEPPARTRMLAVFPLPSDADQLGLRAERLALQSSVTRAAEAGNQVTLTCLQYGVTRQALRSLLTEHEYDIIHVGGHGGYEGLMLMTETDATDFVAADDLLEMLGPQRGKTRLVVLGACDTGANKAARLVGRLHDGTARGIGRLISGERAQGLGSQVARRLNTVVLAMRFAVDDTFSRLYAAAFYEGLLRYGLSVDEACGLALTLAKTEVHDDALGILAEFTPVLYCPDKADLRLQARRSEAPPPPPDPHPFIGRADVLRRMTALLQPGSGIQSVLLTGSRGAGKSACAAEFASGAAGAFDAVIRFSVEPEAPDAAAAQLADQISGGGWPAASAALRSRRLLVIVDGLDAMLTEDGHVPPPWQVAIKVLTSPGSPSRAIFTSRRGVEALEGSGHCAVIGIGALSWDETLLLAAELPRLGPLRQAMRAAESFGQSFVTIQGILGLESAQRHPVLLAALDSISIDLPHLMAGSEILRQLASGVHRSYGPYWKQSAEACRWAQGVLETLTSSQLALASLFATFGTGSLTDTAALDRCWPIWWDAVGDDLPPAVAPLIRDLLTVSVIIEVPGLASDTKYALSPIMGSLLQAGNDGLPEKVRNTVQAAWRSDPDAPAPEARIPVPENVGWATMIRTADELFDQGHREMALRLLYVLGEAGITELEDLHTVAVTHRLDEVEATPREQRLAYMAGIVGMTQSGDRRAFFLRDTFAEAEADGQQDLAAMAILTVMGIELDDNHLDTYGQLAPQVRALASVDPLLQLRVRYEDARYLHKRGEVEAALTEANSLIRDLEQGEPAADPVATLVHGLILEGALEMAADSSGFLRKREDQLRYADQLISLRVQRRAPTSVMARPYLNRAIALASLERVDDAVRMLDAYQRMAADESNSEAVQQAVHLRTLIDLTHGQFTDTTSVWRRVLAVAYFTSQDPLYIGSIHLTLCTTMWTAFLAKLPDTGIHHARLNDEEAALLFAGVQTHLLAGVALLCASSPRLFEPIVEEYGSVVLDDLFDEEITREPGDLPAIAPEDIDFAWVDRRLNADSDAELPFLELMTRTTVTPEHLAARQSRFTEALQALRSKSDDDSEQLRRQIDETRSALEPVFDAVRAAVQGDKRARRDLEIFCKAWDQVEGFQALASALRVLADRRDASGLLGSLEVLNLLLPLILELRPPGIPLDDHPVQPRAPLAASRPDRRSFQPGMARILRQQASELASMDRPADAVTVSKRALEFYEDLSALDRGTYLPELAGSEHEHSLWLIQAGRRADAIPFAKRAVKLLRELVDVNRSDYLADLATGLSSQGVNLAETGRLNDAVPAVQEAFQIRLELAEQDREGYLHDYAVSAMILGHVLVEAARFAEAVAPLAEALGLSDEPSGTDEEMLGIVVNLLRRAYAGNAAEVASQLRALTGQDVPAWMTEPPDPAE